VNTGGSSVRLQKAGFFDSPDTSSQTAERAAAHVRRGLQRMHRSVQPERIYVVQVDPKNTTKSDLGRLRGRTYVFKGGPRGKLDLLGEFKSSSQPSSTGERSAFRAARERGVAHIRPGHYRVSRGLESTYGGAFRIGATPAARDRNRNGVIDRSENRRPERATGILFHSAAYGSAGCQVLSDFKAFATAVGKGKGSTFDYFLVRP
jgi:hypothetical protein